MMRVKRIGRLSEALRQLNNVRSLSAVAQPALDMEMPGMPTLSPASAQPKAETKVTTISNGLRVASEETYGQVATIGLFINAGSRNETFGSSGVSHMIEHMAFKSTDTKSHLRIVREMEELGAIVGAASSRECIMYSGECLREDLGKVIETMADSVLNPKLASWDIQQQKEVIGYELESLEENAPSLVTEILHAAAFGENSPLGRSLWCSPTSIDSLNADSIRSFMKQNFTPDNMVLTAAGVNHEKLVEAAEQFFTAEPNYSGVKTEAAQRSKAEYVGGMKLVESSSQFTHVALGFNPGNWHSDELIDVCTLHFLLGGGGSFSAGGPGKGMYSRLYLNVLNKYHWVDSAIAFNSLYEDSGLFGIYGSAEPNKAGQLLEVFCNEMKTLKTASLTEEEVSRAKNQLKSSMLMKLESRQVLFEDIGRQLLTYGKRESPEELCKKVDAVTADSLKATVTKMLNSKPTVAAFGDITDIPKFEDVVNKFK